jgi:hypothetical protein
MDNTHSFRKLRPSGQLRRANVSWMIFIYLTVLLSSHVSAQVTAYSFTQSVGTYVPIAGGTTILAAGTDDGNSPATSIGFNFTFNGSVFTQFVANSNGNIRLGSAGPTGQYNPISTTTNTNSISGAGRDGRSGVTTLLSGVSPNRVMTIQYTDFQMSYLNTTNPLPFQIKLYETSNVIEIVYGSGSASTSYTCQVGLRGSTVTTDFNNRTTTTNWATSTAGAANTATMSWSTTVIPPTGLTYTFTPPSPCIGTPTPGNTLSTAAAACTGVSFTLSLQNATTGSGVSYQWQRADDAAFSVNLENVTGANNATFATSQTVAKYYRCRVTCSGVDGFSNALLVAMSPPNQCYCIPVTSSGCTDGDVIARVILNTLDNTSGTGCPSGILGYSNYTTNPALTTTLNAGTAYSCTVFAGQYSQGYAAWIDYNDDGVFSPDERIGFSNGQVAGSNLVGVLGSSATFPVVLACNPPVGTHRLRVRCMYATNGINVTPCGSNSFGETEDYNITIAPPPPCPQASGLAASNITDSSVDLAWTIGCIETAWDLEYGATGFAPGTGTTVGTTTNPYTLSGLAPSTAYDIYIRANCGPGNVSAPFGPVAFTTLGPPLCASAPTSPINESGACTGSFITLSWSAVLTATSYDVILDGVTVSTAQTGTTYSAGTGLSAGPHTWSVIPANGFGPAAGCATWNFTLSIPPSVVATNSGAVCAGGDITLNAEGTFDPATTFVWNGPASSNTPGQSILLGGATLAAAGSYTVTASLNGCTTNSSTIAVVNPQPSLVDPYPSAPEVICPGSTVQLVANGGVYNGSPTLGNGNVQNTAFSYPTPYGAYYESVRTQYLYTAAELSAMGLSPGTAITSIAFDVASLSGSGNHTGYTIRMGNTTATALSASNWVSIPATPVFGPVNYQPITGWNTHTLSTLFIWNGDNVVVDICHSNDPTGSGGTLYTSNAVVNATATPMPSAATRYSDNIENCLTVIAPSEISSNRANTRFGASLQGTITWSPNSGLSSSMGAIVDASPAATTTYTITSTAPGGCFSQATVTVPVQTIDTDADGTVDCLDGCPNDPNKIAPGQCGCGELDTDTDGDGTADCNDLCPTDPNKIAPGLCGCGLPDADVNNNGICDLLETLPTVKLGIVPATGDQVEIRLLADNFYAGLFSSSVVTVRWVTTPGVSLNAAAATLVDPAMQNVVGSVLHVGSTTNGIYSYATFATYGSATLQSAGLFWPASTQVPFFRIPYTNTTNACVVFEVLDDAFQDATNRSWYASLNGVESNNGYIAGATAAETAPAADCQNISVTLVGGTATISPQDITSSFVGCNEVTLSLDQSVFSCTNVGQNTVTMTINASGVISTCTATVTVISTLETSATNTPILCNGDLSTVVVSATGGFAPYTGTGSFDVPAGPYSFTVTDAGGCSSTVSGTIGQPDLLTATAVSSSIPCPGGETVVVVSASGGTGAYSGTGSFILPAGNYTFTVSDENGCSVMVDHTVVFTLVDSDGDGVCDDEDLCPGGPEPGTSCDDGNPGTMNDVIGSNCLCQGDAFVTLQPRAFLDGPYNAGMDLMNDNLRSGNHLPLAHPYGGVPFVHSGSESISPAVLTVTGDNAIVDWVLVELRSSSSPATVIARRAALIQRDGDVVDLDGSSPVLFMVAADNYHMAIRHRNHFGAMTALTYPLSHVPTSIDLTVASTATFGNDARKAVGSTMVLWGGNARVDGQLKYSGSQNDRDVILVKIGGIIPTAVVAGYHAEDVNMNGWVSYAGAANDRDPILANLDGIILNIRLQQLP